MKKNRIAVIGLGYVGLPLARLFATKYPVVGYDISSSRVSEIMKGFDKTHEISKKLLGSVLKKNNSETSGLFCSEKVDQIKDCNFYIITVPTPVDNNKQPILFPLIQASEVVAGVLKKGDIVIFESTVYPGTTEEVCVPIIEKISGMKFNVDFYVGYSPERINPGDKKHTVENILKVTSGSDKQSAKLIDQLYKSVISAGTHLAPSIKVAEAAKVIENSQRDINIAFVNELSKIFNLMGINTYDVLSAAATKWNFLNFKPGLVGGHCIGVDPYYLAKKAQDLGYNPEIILAGRKMNDSMGYYVASDLVKCMIKNNIEVKGSDILVMGITFKENCPDVRNSKVVDLISTLKEYELNLTIFDPVADDKQVLKEFGLSTTKSIPNQKFDSIILAVPHNEFRNIDFSRLRKNKSIIYDLKNFLDKSISDKTL